MDGKEEPVQYLLLIGCFDTKAEDFAYLRKCLTERGEHVLSLNTGIKGTTQLFPVDIEADQVAEAAGYSLESLREKADRGHAVSVMGTGAAKVVARLAGEGKLRGAIGMGGGGGTYIALSAMQSIPLGIPKICVSTLAAKDLSRQIGVKDITLMPSVVDVAGLNSISRRLIGQAAAALSAMAGASLQEEEPVAGRIAISMFGNTTPCVDHCKAMLKAQGYEVFVFHATGVGGRTMEALIREDCFDAVLDVTTTELADELCGGVLSAGPERLTAAAARGIPQVVAPGCLDMVNFAQPDTVPAHYRHRQFYSWAPDVTLMRTNAEENRRLGELLARKLNEAKAPAAILLPVKGVSQIAAPGGVFHQPEADQALFEAIRRHAGRQLKVIEVHAHINEEEFARRLVNTLLELIEKHNQ